MELGEYVGLDDREHLQNIADGRYGFAMATLEGDSQPTGQPIWSAHELARAGSLYALFDRSKSISCFLQAASILRKANEPLWVTMSICAESDQFYNPTADDGLRNEALLGSIISSNDSFAAELAYGFGQAMDTEVPELDSLRSNPPLSLTRFNINLDRIRLSILGLANMRLPEPSEAFRCLATMNHVLTVASQNSLHWKRLQSPVLPVEPDFLAFCVVITELLSRHNADLVRQFVSQVQESSPMIAATLMTAMQRRFGETLAN